MPETPAPRLLATSTLGEGDRPTVLLHGFLGSGRNLRALALAWASREPHRRFFLLDLTGHGDSPPLGEGARLDDVAADVLATIDAVSPGRAVTVVGHSLGGRVGLAAAGLAPSQIADLVLLDIAPGAIDPRVSESRRVLDVLLAMPDEAPDRRAFRTRLIDAGLSPALSDWVLMNVRTEGDRATWRIDRRALDALHDAFNRVDLWPVVERRAVPIRCARGGRSRYVTDADAARLEAAGCEVLTLPEAGHYVHVDALAPLVDWLSR